MSQSAETFRRLHAGPDILHLPNCWDAGSARVIEHLGASALATTSAGVAWSLGYRDGGALPIAHLVSVVRAIKGVITVPLSADIEGGYSNDPVEVGELVSVLVDVGVVGINLEDGSGSPELLAAKITHAKRAAARANVDVFVNARTDVYLRALVEDAERAHETTKRAELYRNAGADGLFVPKVVRASEIEEIATAVRLPLNILAWPGLPDMSTLASIGVRRLSAGSVIAQLALGSVAAAARAFLAQGRVESEGAFGYADMNALF